MGFDYDSLYRSTPDALGEPAGALVALMRSLGDPPLRVLDIGCGQGRDAIPLARMGHHVTGIDLSPAGIADLARAAARDALPITAQVADIRDYIPDGTFDVLLFDRVLHMLPAPDRHAALSRLAAHVLPGGAILIADEPSNIPALRQCLLDSGQGWQATHARRGTLLMRLPGPPDTIPSPEETSP